MARSTTMLIAHRLDSGRIVAEGPHSTLLAQDERYMQRYQVQAKEYCRETASH
jgi:ABC-type multidrug transport system fused ATPase/permease subunit